MYCYIATELSSVLRRLQCIVSRNSTPNSIETGATRPAAAYIVAGCEVGFAFRQTDNLERNADSSCVQSPVSRGTLHGRLTNGS